MQRQTKVEIRLRLVISLAIDTEKRQIAANTELKGGLALADGTEHIAFHGIIDMLMFPLEYGFTGLLP